MIVPCYHNQESTFHTLKMVESYYHFPAIDFIQNFPATHLILTFPGLSGLMYAYIIFQNLRNLSNSDIEKKIPDIYNKRVFVFDIEAEE